MRAIVVERFGGYQNLKLVEIPQPAVLDGRVLVRITAVGLAWGDVLQAQGKYSGGPSGP